MNDRTAASQSRLEGLVTDILQHMQGLGYSAAYMQVCRGVWRDFIRFSAQSSVEEFSQEVASRFSESCGITVESHRSGLSHRQRVIRAAMRILAEFNVHGCYQRRRRTMQEVELPASLHAVRVTYRDFCSNHLRCKSGSIRGRMRHITRFLHFLASHEVHDPTAIRAQHLSQFVRSQIHLSAKTLAVIVSDLRSFMRFLCMEAIVSDDLSPQVPKVRIPRDARIPTVWSPDDVEAILKAVDRSSPKGKRDFAILLLACRLGMRVSDIRSLQLDNIRWDDNRIELAQAKTEVTLALPLTEEVGEALIDYLQHGRPLTSYREVFLRLKAPIAPFSSNDNLHHIITFYRQRAAIAIPPQGRKGMHSLRHSVATRLLEVGTPLEVIASIMGHLSLESTQIYTRVDIQALRTAALDWEVTNE